MVDADRHVNFINSSNKLEFGDIYLHNLSNADDDNDYGKTNCVVDNKKGL